METTQKKASRKIRLTSVNLRKYFNPDKIVGTSAFIISLGTFFALVIKPVSLKSKSGSPRSRLN